MLFMYIMCTLYVHIICTLYVHIILYVHYMYIMCSEEKSKIVFIIIYTIYSRKKLLIAKYVTLYILYIL